MQKEQKLIILQNWGYSHTLFYPIISKKLTCKLLTFMQGSYSCRFWTGTLTLCVALDSTFICNNRITNDFKQFSISAMNTHSFSLKYQGLKYLLTAFELSVSCNTHSFTSTRTVQWWYADFGPNLAAVPDTYKVMKI